MYIQTCESVGKGHPDKVADRISDAILDECLQLDPDCHVGCETLVAKNLVVNAGEITCKDWQCLNLKEIVKKQIEHIGYNDPGDEFSSTNFEYINRISKQSPDINMGVTKGNLYDTGAGDQGMMFGYATAHSQSKLPLALEMSHNFLAYLETQRLTSVEWLKPDCKCQISIQYDKSTGLPILITDIVLSHQTQDMPIDVVRRDLTCHVSHFFSAFPQFTPQTKLHINPTGRFVIGGPAGDSGLTGRKIIVDTYGGVCHHGGGAFSGKDPTKVDRSAAYYTRYAAKNIVCSGIVDTCQVNVAYSIGESKPIDFDVHCHGSDKVKQKLKEILKSNLFDFRPGAIIDQLQLKNPVGWCYKDTSSYGHFGRNIFPWEQLDLVKEIQRKFE